MEQQANFVKNKDDLKEQGEAITAIKEKDKKEKKEEYETQSQILIRLGCKATYFHDELKEAYALVPVEDHMELWKLNGKMFKMWLTKIFYEETGKAPTSDAMNQALRVLEVEAILKGKEHCLALRVAERGNTFYYDLNDENKSVVKIEPNVCQIIEGAPILFKRNKNMKYQVRPKFDGNFKLLLNHVRFKNEDDQLLYLVYIVTCLIPNIPHVVLVLSGEQGAAKSTSLRITRKIVDPAVRELVTMPNSIQDLALTLANNYMPTFDNLDTISAEKSDLLCTASTGGAFTKRTLYSDDDETLLEIRRCVGMTGINVVVTRADLLDRSLLLELDRVPEVERKEERLIWEEFENDRASIVGGAFQTLAKAMAIFPNVEIDRLPRMADFTRWGYAIAEVLGYGGERFLEAYRKNQVRSNEEAISSHPVASAMVALMKSSNSWKGSVSQLLDELEIVAERERIQTNVSYWPRAPHALSRRLKGVKSNLQEIGIEFEIRNTGPNKEIDIKNMKPDTVNVKQVQQEQAPRKKMDLKRIEMLMSKYPRNTDE